MNRQKIVMKVLAPILTVTMVVTSSAQVVTHPSKRAESIARKVAALGNHSKISVIPLEGREKYGELLSSDQEGFTFHDVDRNTEVTLKYVDVRKVKKGYGGYNYATGTHTDRKKALIVSVCVLGAIGGILAALASARN